MIGLLKYLFTKFVMAVLVVLVGFLGILGFRYWEANQPVEVGTTSSSSQVNYMEMDCWTTTRGCSVGVFDSSVPPEVLERRVGVQDIL